MGLFNSIPTKLANALVALAKAGTDLCVAKTNEILSGGHECRVTWKDLADLERRLMANEAEIIQDLTDAVASITQVNKDIADTQTKITALNAKVKELEDVIAAGGSSERIAALAKQVKELGKQADDALPNPVEVPPTPEPPTT